MTQQQQNRKEDFAKETAVLKDTIDIVALLNYLGIIERREKSSQSWLAYDFPTKYDGEFRMLVPRTLGIHKHFISPDGFVPNTTNKGGGVDLIAKLHTGDYKEGMNLLRNYAMLPSRELTKYSYEANTPASKSFNKAKVCENIMLEYREYIPVFNGQCKYLNDRGINENILKHPNFEGRLYQQQNGWKNTGFPTFGEDDAMVTIQERNNKFKSLAPYDLGNSMWSSLPPQHKHMIKQIVIGESPEDVLSFLQMNTNTKDSFYALSTFGQMSALQLNRLTKIILATKAETVYLVQDNDIAGWKYRVNLLANITNEFEPKLNFMVDNTNIKITIEGTRTDAFGNATFESIIKSIDQEDIVFSNEQSFILPNTTKNVFQAKITLTNEDLTHKLISNLQHTVNKRYPYINIKSAYALDNDFNNDLKKVQEQSKALNESSKIVQYNLRTY